MAGFTEEQYEQSQNATSANPPKGSEEWAVRNSGTNAPQQSPASDPVPGTLEDNKQQQDNTSTKKGGVSASNPQTQSETPALSPEQQQRIDAIAGIDHQIKTIQDWMDAEDYRQETKEDRKKRERRERSKRIIAAVSDGISALSNLYFTSQYAPNMYNHGKGSMTTAVDTRLDRLKAERERKRDRHLNFSMKLGYLKNQRAATLRDLEALQARQKLEREKAQREAEQHNWLAL